MESERIDKLGYIEKGGGGSSEQHSDLPERNCSHHLLRLRSQILDQLRGSTEMVERDWDLGNLKAELVFRDGCDLTFINPTIMDIQSCMAARYDAGIVKHRKEHTGVIEIWQIKSRSASEE